MMSLPKDFKATHGVNVRYVHFDKAKECDAFEWLCKQKGMGVTFDYTAPGISQKSGRVKRAFTTLLNQICALLNGGQFSHFFNMLYWQWQLILSCYWKNLIVKSRHLSRFHNFL